MGQGVANEGSLNATRDPDNEAYEAEIGHYLNMCKYSIP